MTFDLIASRMACAQLGGAALALAMTATAATAQDHILRLHQFLPAQAAVPAHILDPWADRIEEASNGRIEIQRFPAMQLGGAPPQLIDQAIDGTVDIVWTLPGYTPGRFPRTEVFELPFMMTGGNAEATSRAYWQLAEETMMDTDFADLHVLGLWVHGPGVIRRPLGPFPAAAVGIASQNPDFDRIIFPASCALMICGAFVQTKAAALRLSPTLG